MNSIRRFIKDECFGWNKLEIAWLFIACSMILSLSLYWKDNIIGILCALTGCICVIATGKGKLTCYITGLINCALYAYIAWGAKYYGEVMLNVLYYIPMQFVGWFMWQNNINPVNKEVIKKQLTMKYKLLLFSSCLSIILIYGTLLKSAGGNAPFIDSISTILSVVAMILSVNRLTEQWLLWIVVDIVTVIMWILAFFTGGASVATLLMWIVYLLNAIFMYIKWHLESKEA